MFKQLRECVSTRVPSVCCCAKCKCGKGVNVVNNSEHIYAAAQTGVADAPTYRSHLEVASKGVHAPPQPAQALEVEAGQLCRLPPGRARLLRSLAQLIQQPLRPALTVIQPGFQERALYVALLHCQLQACNCLLVHQFLQHATSVPAAR